MQSANKTCFYFEFIYSCFISENVNFHVNVLEGQIITFFIISDAEMTISKNEYTVLSLTLIMLNGLIAHGFNKIHRFEDA